MDALSWMKKHQRPFKAAHRHCGRHREEVLRSKHCRCFYCLATFSPADIRDWVDEGPEDLGRTALCPRCGIDSVIGSASEVPFDDDFFEKMKDHYFS